MTGVQLAFDLGEGVADPFAEPFVEGVTVPSVRAHRRVRWPLADLLEALRVRAGVGPWAATVALRCGANVRQVHRWRHDGLTSRAADEAACRAGLHPALVWPSWHD